MTIIWLTLVMVFLSGCFAQMTSNSTIVNGVALSRPNKLFSTIAMAVLVLVSGLRSNIGDTGYYKYGFINIVPDNIFSAFETFTLYNGDLGFMVFQSFIKDFISTDPQALLFICALITNVFIMIVLYKYSPAFELSLFLYITTGAYFFTMNTMRQYLISAILFLCIKLIVDGKWLPFFVLVLLLSTMHSSGLIFIPVYFFVRLKPWSKLVVTAIVVTAAVLLLFNQIGSSLLDLLMDTQYGHYKEFILSEDSGANLIRTLVATVPVVLAYLGRKQLEKSNDKLIDVILNFSVLNLVFQILALQNLIFARFSVYFGLYNLLLLPWLIKNLFDKQTSAIFYGASLILYIIFYYYEMESYLSYWGIGYRSDFIGL